MLKKTFVLHTYTRHKDLIVRFYLIPLTTSMLAALATGGYGLSFQYQTFSFLFFGSTSLAWLRWRNARDSRPALPYRSALDEPYSLLLRLGEAIVEAGDRDTLLSQVCRIIVDTGQFKSACVSLIDPHTGYRRCAALATRSGYSTVQAVCQQDGDGPMAAAMSAGIRQISDRTSCSTCGTVAAMGAFPLSSRGRIVGALVLHATRAEFLGREQVALLTSMAASISHAIDKLALEEERHLADEKLRIDALVFEESDQAILICDAANRIVSVNRAFSAITGYSLEEVQGRNPNLLSSGEHEREFYRELWAILNESGYWSGEIWNRCKNGKIYPEWLSINAVWDKDAAITHYVGVFSDTTELKAAADRMRHLAHHDSLTGLPNRIMLTEWLKHALARASLAGSELAVLFLDLDQFKLVNDTLGHTVGDELLKATAGRLAGCVRPADMVARLGGDEFVIVLDDVTGSRGAATVAQKIINALAQPLILEQHELVVTPSIGIGLYPDDGGDAETLIKHADVAMYRAKERGRNNYQLFTADMHVRAFERLAMENSLRRALERNEFLLHYQPQIDLGSRRIIGMEALLRWRQPKGLIPPAQFIPIAEEIGLIIPIGEWVLRTACARNKAWQDAGFAPLRVAVNLSARQFRMHNLVAMVRSALTDSGLAAQCLELEITESIAMDHIEETIAKLDELKAMGVGIAMDDFGTGYSSLGYLKRFPIDRLKIDRSFVRDITTDPDDATIAVSIISLAHAMRLEVVAEGVETEAQLAYLSHHGCDEVQGYYFSPPLATEEFAAMLKAGGRLPEFGLEALVDIP